ncbi:MAG: histidine phosphatase family protein [Candidatus Korarchaeota archaeon]|nr:histidine phosphatase family protein [Candidatus Korarchaeota archaeon]NIU85550.1 hypothetical protein [Candidatus Thorarchaeota archaeon]NIW15661.1 hypothetical protein [Candidatus Thorarchaeota archaeon]NIW53591.1 hypothetical protein [Candidatus Korarchaeota archaeon]
MQDLLLVRHGASEHLAKNFTGGWTDLPLTNRGRWQAQETGKRLQTVLTELIGTDSMEFFASDLVRATETAEIIASYVNQEPEYVPALREINNGVARDRSLEEAIELRRPREGSLLDWVRYEQGESRRMLFNRVSAFLEKRSSETVETVLLASHMHTISCIIHWWLDLPVEYLNTIFYHVDPCSITILSVSRFGEKTIKKLNETAHLSDELFTSPT